MIGRAPQQGQGVGMPDFVWLNGLAGGDNHYCQDAAAFAGGGQASSTPIGAPNAQGIQACFVNLSVVATGGDSVQLPQAIAGKFLFVSNSGAASANIYANPNTSKATGTKDTINGNTNVTAYALANGVSAVFFCPKDGLWAAIKSA